MMLKERTNRWARLKLLFVVPVMGGALYAFAQPEVKEDLGLNTVREVLQSKTGEDQDIFKFVDDEMEAYYNRSPKNAELKYKIRERQTHIVKVDANGQLTLNNKTIAKEDLKEVLKKQWWNISAWQKKSITVQRIKWEGSCFLLILLKNR